MTLEAYPPAIQTGGLYDHGFYDGSIATGGLYGAYAREIYFTYRDDGAAGDIDYFLPVGVAEADDATISIDGQSLAATYTDTDTKLLCHFDGADAAATTVDSSLSVQTIALAGGAVLDTAQKKFGNSSLYFGVGGTATVADDADWDYGTGNFTIDFWLRLNEAPFANSIFQTTGAGGLLYISSTSDTLAASLNGGAVILTSAAIVWLVNTWYHIALVRNGNTISLYRNGILLDSGDCTGMNLTGFGDISLNPSECDCWMDELHISHVAEWAAAFDVPTRAWGYEDLKYWNFTRCCVSAGGSIGDPSDAVTICVDASGLLHYPVGNDPTDVVATVLAGGVVRIAWKYNPAHAPATPTGFEIANDTTVLGTAAYRRGTRYYYTSGALAHGTAVTPKVRTYRTVSGITYYGNWVSGAAVNADATGPAAIDDVTLAV